MEKIKTPWQFPMRTASIWFIRTARQLFSECQTTYDLILCDLFDHARHESCISQVAFYTDVFWSLAPGGIMVINTLPGVGLVAVQVPGVEALDWD